MKINSPMRFQKGTLFLWYTTQAYTNIRTSTPVTKKIFKNPFSFPQKNATIEELFVIFRIDAVISLTGAGNAVLAELYKI